MKTYHVHAEFVQPILGTASADPEIHERFIASKAPDAKRLEEEVGALGVDELVERGTTVFPRTKDGTPFLWDYQIKGFFKDAAGACRQMDGMDASRRLVAHKSKIDQLVFVTPRNVRLHMPEGSEVRVMQRPLRAQTARGERVALAASEMLDAGTVLDFDVLLMAERTGGKTPTKLVDCLKEWLWYGQMRGIGQWRNGGFGQFRCTLTDKETGEVLLDTLNVSDS